MKLLTARLATLALLVGGTVATALADAPTLYWGSDGLGTSGSWTAADVNWWDGAQATAWTDDAAAVFQGAGGTIDPYVFGPTASSFTFTTPGYTLSSAGWINGGSSGLVVNTLADATIGSTLRDDAPFDANGLTKTGPGTLTVTGTNFFGDVRVAEGEYMATSTSGAFFSDFRVESGATLTLAPEDFTSLAVGSISGSGLVRPDAQARTVTAMLFGIDEFTGRLEDNGSGILAVEFIATAGDRLLSAAEYTGATTVSAGTLTLASFGAITDTASLTINGSARLKLDNQSVSSSANRLADNAPVQLRNGGTLEITSSLDGVTELAGPLTTTGSGKLVLSATMGLHAPAIQFSSFQRTEGSTLAISGTGTATLTGITNGPTGIVTPAITINNEWAVIDGGPGQLTAFTAYAGKFDGGSPADHVKLTTASTTVAASLTRASLNLASNNAAPQQLALQGTLTLTSGGLLSSGAQAGSISGGALSAPAELIVTNANALTISSAIVNTGSPLALTKSGAGTLTLAGANSYSGITTLDEGTLAIASASALGNGSAIVFGGGTLQALGDFTLAKNLAGVGGGTAAIDTNGHTVVATGALSGGLSKTGAGTLQLQQAQLGTVNVLHGTLVASNAASGSVSLSGDDTRLEARGALDSLSLTGNVTLGLGAAGEAAALSLGRLTSQGSSFQLTLDFDLGSTSQDLLTLLWPSGMGPINPGSFQFAFHDLGGLSTGVDYKVIAFGMPGGFWDASDFALAPALSDAGWTAQFRTDLTGVTVNFSAIPEPATAGLLALGLAAAGWAAARRKSTTA